MGFIKTETMDFNIFYDEKDADIIDAIKEYAIKKYRKVQQDFALSQEAGKFDLFLCPDVETYIEYTNMSKETYQNWMVGWTNYNMKRLCILSPRVVCNRSYEEMLKVIVHEMVHIVMDSLREAEALETWISEGIALLYAEQIYWSLSEDNLPKLDSLAEGESFADNGGYDYAGVYVWYFIEKYGFENFKKVYMGSEQAGKYLYPQFEVEAVTHWNEKNKFVRK